MTALKDLNQPQTRLRVKLRPGNGMIIIENGREHGNALLGEGERRVFRMLAPLQQKTNICIYMIN